MSQPTKLLGEFVWFDMMTTDLEKSLAFYKGLFPEWDIQAQEVAPGFVYHMIHIGGRKTGGFVPMEGEGPPTHWISYVSVEDCDAAIEKAESMGAKTLVPAFSAPGVGRMAVMSDPSGAYFKPMALDEPMDPKTKAPGDFIWLELATPKLDEMEQFYGQLFGWSFNRVEMAPGEPYLLANIGELEIAGMMNPQEGMPAMWVPYIETGGVDERHKKAVELGATTIVPPSDIPNVGRFAYLQDPCGAFVAIFEDGKVGG